MCLLAKAADALAALEIAGVLVTTILVLLSEGFHRQPFIDLAVVLAPMALIGSLDVRAADGAAPVNWRIFVATVLLIARLRDRAAGRARARASCANTYDRLHYVGLVGYGALLIAVAVVFRESFSLIGDKALLVAAILVVTGPGARPHDDAEHADPRARATGGRESSASARRTSSDRAPDRGAGRRGDRRRRGRDLARIRFAR